MTLCDQPEAEQEYKPRWEINYDALYNAQDDYVDATDDLIIEEPSKMPQGDLPSTNQVEAVDEPSDLSRESQEIQDIEVDESASKECLHLTNSDSLESDEAPCIDPPEEEEKYKDRWQINYDAIYAAQDDIEVEEQEEEVDKVNEVSEIASIESEVPKSTDIELSSGTVDTNENELLTDPINSVQNESCLETEDGHNDVSEYKPKWEINYDAIYAAQDDEVDDELDEIEELPSIESEVPKSTDVVQSSAVVGTTEDALFADPTNPVPKESCHETEDDEIVPEYKPKWEINYDAIYAAQDDEVDDGMDGVEGIAPLESEVPKSTNVQSGETVGSTEKKLSTDPINPVSNESCHEPEDDDIEDVSEYKPKWEINYDAI